MLSRRDLPVALALFCLFACWYAFTGNGYIDSLDGETVYHVTEALVERGTFAQLGPELAGDIHRSVTSGYDGRLYAITAPLHSLLAVPLYSLGTWVAHGFPVLFKPYFTRFFVTLLNSLLGAATVALFYLFSLDLGYRRRTALFLTVALALTTLISPYARFFFTEMAHTFWLVLMAWSAYRYGQTGRPGWMAVSAASLGLGIATKYVMVMAAPALALYLLLLWRRQPTPGRWLGRTVWAGGLPLLLIGLALAGFNYFRFHDWLETGYTAPEMRGSVNEWWGAPSLVESLYGFFLSSGKGFFFFSPLTWLSWWGWGAWWRRQRLATLLSLTLVVLYPLFYGVITNPNEALPVWVGGIAWGPRYLVCVTPFLLLPVGAFLERQDLPRRWRSLVVGSLFVIGFWVQLSSLLVNYYTFVLGPTPLENQLYRPHDSVLLGQWRLWPAATQTWRAYWQDAAHRSPAFYWVEGGFYEPEVPALAPWGRWMSAEGQVWLYARPRQEVTVHLTYSRPRPADALTPWTGLTWVYNGQPLTADRHLLVADDRETQWVETVSLSATALSFPGFLQWSAPTWQPLEQGDPRALSVFISRLEILSDGVPVPRRTIRPLPLTWRYPWSQAALMWFLDAATPRLGDWWPSYVLMVGLPPAQARRFILIFGGTLVTGLLLSALWLRAALKKAYSSG